MSRKVFLLILSPFFLVLLLFIIAFIELNALSFLIKSNPEIIGIQKDKGAIVHALKENNLVPKIVVAEPEKIAFAIAAAMSGDNGYASYILENIPQSLILQNQKGDMGGLLLMDNTLFITDIDASDLEDISPIVGYLFVKEYFTGREIKVYPDVKIMQKDEYVNYRKDFFAEKFSGIDDEIKKITDTTARIIAEIQYDEIMIGKNQKVIEESLTLKETKYKKCCSALRKRLDKEIIQSKKNINDWEIKRQQDKMLLEEYKQYVDFYKKQKDLMQQKKENIPYELGVFEAEKSIKIALRQAPHQTRLRQDEHFQQGLDFGKTSKNEKLVAEYLGTLMHEYMHYSSYVSKDLPAGRQGKKIKNEFFEEGLTEYFARKVMSNHFENTSNLAYPLQVKIIEEMTKKIPEREFEKIYFEKDEKRLEEVLDKTYGKDFYKNNQIVMQTLQYTTESKQALTIANIIMKKIGGEKISNF